MKVERKTHDSTMDSDSQTTSAAPGSSIRGVPEGCQRIPGYILDVFDGSAWITQEGRVTDKWHERGVWPTQEAAAEAMQRFLSPNTKLSDGATK